ncbi:MAG: LysR family transcriptional regulator [Myxococcales bacterium]|nr:LysR family transcriptional regulator [Myxococcales bacterium]
MNAAHVFTGDWNQLRVLDALLRTESTVQAARELGLTQSAVSHTLRKLRVTFDDPLLVRVGRRLRTTERARELRGPLDEAMAATQRVFSRAASFDPKSLSTSFRIVASDYAEVVLLPALLRGLDAEAPGVDVVISSAGDASEDVVQSGRFDLFLGVVYRERAGLLHRTLHRDRFVCVSRAEGSGRRMTRSRYLAARHVLVSPRGLPGGVVDEHLAAKGERRRVVCVTPTFQTALALVAETGLVTTIPERLVRASPLADLLRIERPPLDLPELRLGMLYPASRQNDASHRWLRERLVASLG